MLIKSCVYLLVIILGLSSIELLRYSKNSRDFYTCKRIMIISSFYILYLLICLLVLVPLLHIPVGLEILLYYAFSMVTGIIHLIVIILNNKKIKTLPKKSIKSKKYVTTLLMILVPLLVLTSVVLRNLYVINTSNLFLVYNSAGNGGFGDGNIFAYAINDKSCQQFDLGIDNDGYYLNKYLPKDSIEISDISNIQEYNLIFDTNSEEKIIVYKNNKEICTINISPKYYNISFKTGYYKK